MDSIVERQRGIVTEHIRGENDHDWPAVYDTFVQDDRAYYDVVPLGTRFKGIEGVRSFYQAIATAMPDLHIEVTSEYDVPGCSIREVVITGTHKGEFACVKPLGNAIRIEMASFMGSTQGQENSSQSEYITTKRAYSGRCKASKGPTLLSRN